MTNRDIFLIGFDTVYKDKSVIFKAYNDDLGVTRKFIMNILKHMIDKYNLLINENDFEYEGCWNEEYSRMEMLLKCINDTQVMSANRDDSEKIKA